ncbi:MAG: hypothetical protein JWQ02_3938 [Capsulimonas sp.]|nr:hypothetical protein [Capsulimonas sp.]
MSPRSTLRLVFGTFAVVAVTLHFLCMQMLNAGDKNPLPVTHVASAAAAR